MMNISRHHSNESNRNLATPTGAYRDSKHRNAADAFVLSQSDAHWFLELPETIRRKHFSKEERIILANKCESIIVDAADESLYRMGCQKIGRRFSSVSTASDVGSLSELDFSLDKDVQQAREDVRKSFQWMGADQDLDLQLHQFQETDPAPPPPPVQECPLTTITRKRRTLSLSKPRKTHSSQSSILPPAFARNRMSVSSRRNNTPPQSFSPEPPYQRNTHSSESDATYYQDPEARLKLRVYLASPAKFDEAIEFGFPSQTDAHKNFNRPRIPTVRRVHCDFEDSGTETDPELVDDYADTRSIGESVVEDLLEEEEEIDLQPDEMPLPGSSGSNSSTIKAFPIMNTHYPHTRPANREMTLRMTLTRKDLRAYEVTMPTPTTPTSPVHQIMTLEDLPPEKEQLAGAIDWAALDKNADQSGLRKLWKRVTGH